jgi:hypothetical protein
MATTAVSTISTERICLNPHEGRCVLGTAGENVVPGQVCMFYESTGVWMLADTDDTTIIGYRFSRIGIAGYEKRVNPSTMALKTITDAWVYNSAGDKLIPFWISGICIAYITDQNGDLPAGHHLMISGTAGSFTAYAHGFLENMITATSGTGMIQPAVAALASRCVDDDTVCIVGIGKNFGDVWGGFNASG